MPSSQFFRDHRPTRQSDDDEDEDEDDDDEDEDDDDAADADDDDETTEFTNDLNMLKNPLDDADVVVDVALFPAASSTSSF